MMILTNASLIDHNTLGFEAKAQFLVEITDAHQIPTVIDQATSENMPWRVLGGGSNVVIGDDLPGYTLLMKLQGKEFIPSLQGEDFLEIRVMAGESWHEFVAWTIDQDAAGLENLALIPGTVGAAPVQNIGAYGAELSQFVKFVEVYDTLERVHKNLCVQDCQFAYRDSLFKIVPNRFIVISVTFALPKKWQANLSYGELRQAFEGNQAVSPRQVFDKVCEIRSRKLPDPRVLGNVGSFFHNPVVTAQHYEDIKTKHPEVIAYPVSEGYKLAAGWLIESCGFKGRQDKEDGVGVYEKQALVLVNRGLGTAIELLDLAQQIQKEVSKKFGVNLTIEPTLWLGEGLNQ